MRSVVAWAIRNGRLLAYLLLAAGVITALWWTSAIARHNQDLICREQNQLRVAITRALEDTLLPPRPVPREASDDLEEFINQSDRRSEEIVEVFREEMEPIDCNERFR